MTKIFPAPSLSQIRKFIGQPTLNLPAAFLEKFFHPQRSDEAIRELRSLYGRNIGAVVPGMDVLQITANETFDTARLPFWISRLAFWDFCRRRTPWGCHPAHLAALAGLTWRHNRITKDLFDLNREWGGSGSASELAASMWPYRQSSLIMKPAELAGLNALPQRLTLYRGGYCDEDELCKGVSWTDSAEVAGFYSSPVDWLIGKPDEQGNVIQREFDRDDIVALMFFRSTRETIVCPDLAAAMAANVAASETELAIVEALPTPLPPADPRLLLADAADRTDGVLRQAKLAFKREVMASMVSMMM